MKYHILLGFLSVAAAYPYPGLGHEEHALIGESEHHHQVEHEHAKSHQSIKFEHFHPVPVYVKKEHHHLLEHPLESGKHENELKQIHPETQHNHGHGLVLEDHRFNTEELAHGPEHGGFEGGFQHGGYELGGFEGLKAYGGGEYELHQPALEAEAGTINSKLSMKDTIRIATKNSI